MKIGVTTARSIDKASTLFEALNSFRKDSNLVSKQLVEELMRGGIKNPSAVPGRLYTFKYNAKHREILPYWDENPVILMVNKYEDGFLGLNFHYLPLDLRVRCLHTLDSQTRPRDLKTLMINWEKIKSSAVSALGKIAVKRYLKDHMKSKLIHIPARDWYIALALPIAKFHKATENAVGNIAKQRVNK